MKYKKVLEELKEENSLKGVVAEILLNEVSDHDNDTIKGFIEDLLNHGCVSGMVGALIYYDDSIKFYDDNEELIEDLVQEQKESLGYSKRSEFISSLNGSAEDITQEKNLLSWFAFEETARDIFINDLGGEW
jgi:hypothetical protein